MSLPGPKCTYQDYLLLADDKRYEVIEGELLVTPAPSLQHQTVSSNLHFHLDTFVRPRGLGRVYSAPTDVILSNENVVQPDILFVSRERLATLKSAGGLHGAPDLVAEILSPSTSSRDQIQKRKLYGKYGVREFWLVDPVAQAVEVLIPGRQELETWRVFRVGEALISPLLPDLSLPVAEIFAE